eukprot:CAMPEP_0172725070 /NCGR_PEP_ID=MMETSP1074-20121228/87514_1 /TAXON_ID=2916 /ORGANISM="Ceratium fusus, Strain PA161109" /LENGTH=133 /DNA_ID=CAMNT_0013551757 /DNA_START=124 /DNA_END=526 /DNA_ORIENTATION=+
MATPTVALATHLLAQACWNEVRYGSKERLREACVLCRNAAAQAQLLTQLDCKGLAVAANEAVAFARPSFLRHLITLYTWCFCNFEYPSSSRRRCLWLYVPGFVNLTPPSQKKNSSPKISTPKCTTGIGESAVA